MSVDTLPEVDAVIRITSAGCTVLHDDVVVGTGLRLLEAVALKRAHDDLMTPDEPQCARCTYLWTQRTCDKHGEVTAVDGGCSPGFAGGGIYWETLSCGCQTVDDTDDLAAAR